MPRRKRSPTTRANLSRMEALSARMNTVVRADLIHGLTTFRANADLGKLASAMGTGDFRQVMQTIKWKDLTDKLSRTNESLHAAARIGGELGIKVLPKQAQPNLRYAPSNPNIKKYIDGRTGELITTVKEGTLAAVKEAVHRSMTQAVPPSTLARQIRGSIGLNERQAVALGRYRASLQAEATHKTAAIESLVSAYSERLLDARAIMIARTEVRNASNQGQIEVWQAAQKEGLLPPSVKKVWVVDGNPCPICEPMEGVAVDLDEPWQLNTGDEVYSPSESHPNCMCLSSVTL